MKRYLRNVRNLRRLWIVITPINGNGKFLNEYSS